MRESLRLFVVAAMFATASSAALAASAVTTANVNFRSGPGTGYGVIRTLPAGTAVEMMDCDESGAWCAISAGGQSGFVSGQYLQESEDQTAWPRAFTTDTGASLILHQPQITEWEDFLKIKALVAAEYKPKADADPVFGVIGLAGRTQADHETKEVVIDDITVTELNFSALDRDQLSAMALEVGKLLPTGSITTGLERLTASLAAYQQLADVEGLKADPPPIFVSKTPAVLLQTEGVAVTAPVEGVEGLSFVVNTNWDLFKVGDDYYLRDDESWLKGASLSGEWQATTSLPEQFSKLPDEESWKDSRAAMPPKPYEGAPPKVIYSDAPAELILFDGEPKLEDVPNTGLQWASNSESDVFYMPPTSTWYVLLSGRWFRSTSLDGPWTFTTPDLPDDFRRIPDGTPYYTVRASVPGTSESDEARLKAMIPQTARVKTDGSVTASVSYVGDPDFQPVEGTQLSYAANTDAQVIRVGDKYYVLQDGIWFVGDSPEGPFAVATSVPQEIYEIPPSSPVYNVTYVRIYETEPDAVWYGYTAGYLGAYLAWNTFVYGSGWYYPPYWGWYGAARWPIYYPRPVTYGIGAYYNPVRGTYGRYGYAYGPYRGIGRATYYNPRSGTIVRAGGSYGPLGQRGFVAAYNPRTGTGGIVAGGHNIYGSWGSAAGVTRGADWARARGVGVSNTAASQWRTSLAGAGITAGRRAGDNVFAGRDGNVYRNVGGQWQQNVGGKWGAANLPAASRPGAGVARPSTPQVRPSAPQVARPNLPQKPQFQAPARMPSHPTIQTPPIRNMPSHLGADQFGRQFGNQLSHQSRNYARPSVGARPSGGFSGGGARAGGFRGGGRR